MVTLQCTRGSARLRVSSSRLHGSVQILTGKRRVWDGLHWSLYSESEVALQGLWKGHYADAVVKCEDFVDALRSLGAVETADAVEAARLY
jgi:hypothetical protein